MRKNKLIWNVKNAVRQINTFITLSNLLFLLHGLNFFYMLSNCALNIPQLIMFYLPLHISCNTFLFVPKKIISHFKVYISDNGFLLDGHDTVLSYGDTVIVTPILSRLFLLCTYHYFRSFKDIVPLYIE
jgi:hypothetical protein